MQRTAKRKHEPYLKFKAYLIENSLKQEYIAELIGKTKVTLNQKINGTGPDFTPAELRLICNTLNISADTFFIA